VPPQLRQDLFIQKIRQCMVVFDFSDASSELNEKEIKRHTLQEILEYIVTNRGVLTEALYPEITNMVKKRSMTLAIQSWFNLFLLSLSSTSSVPFLLKSIL
jgi:hypothetical protein